MPVERVIENKTYITECEQCIVEIKEEELTKDLDNKELFYPSSCSFCYKAKICDIIGVIQNGQINTSDGSTSCTCGMQNREPFEVKTEHITDESDDEWLFKTDLILCKYYLTV